MLLPDDISFIAEAVKWSVLFEEAETKQKQEFVPDTQEYVLNPIYAPYFTTIVQPQIIKQKRNGSLCRYFYIWKLKGFIK